MSAETTFRYIPYDKNQASVCFTRSEKETIESYIPRARFVQRICDLDEKYDNKVACFRNRYRPVFLRLLERRIFSYSNEESEDLVFYSYPVNIGRENYSNMYVINHISDSAYEFLIDQLYHGKIGSNIFLNCIIAFLDPESYKLREAHHFGISITKSNIYGRMDLKVYDTSNYDRYEMETMSQALQKLYNNLSNLDISSPPLTPFYIPIQKRSVSGYENENVTVDELIEKFGHLPHKKTEIPEWEMEKYMELSPRTSFKEENNFGDFDYGDWGMEEDIPKHSPKKSKDDDKKDKKDKKEMEWSPLRAELLENIKEEENFQKIMAESYFESYRMVNLNISYEFNEYLKQKNFFGADSVSVSIQDGDNIFQTGMCTAWTLYFIVQIHIIGKTSYEVYDLILNMNPILRSKFIYVWYDLLLFALKIEGEDLDLESLSVTKIQN